MRARRGVFRRLLRTRACRMGVRILGRSRARATAGFSALCVTREHEETEPVRRVKGKGPSGPNTSSVTSPSDPSHSSCPFHESCEAAHAAPSTVWRRRRSQLRGLRRRLGGAGAVEIRVRGVVEGRDDTVDIAAGAWCVTALCSGSPCGSCQHSIYIKERVC